MTVTFPANSSNRQAGKPSVGILEDEPAMRRLLGRLLANEYDCLFFDSGSDLTDAISKGAIKIVMLDIMLPGEDGITIAKSIRARSAVPIILISGLSSSETIVSGLNVGADEYVTKPFDPDVLQARLRNVLRRTGTQSAEPQARPRILQIGPCEVDVWARTARRPGGLSIRLTEKELQILSALAGKPEIAVDRDTLSRLLTGQDWSPTNRCLDVHLSNLRSKLFRVCERRDLITCYRGVGYALTTSTMQA
jgi:DNA-binding response OmpR family regulator